MKENGRFNSIDEVLIEREKYHWLSIDSRHVCHFRKYQNNEGKCDVAAKRPRQYGVEITFHLVAV